jgi:proteasome lid subunit RPN8/RPN11
MHRTLHLPHREWRRLRRRAYAAQQDDLREVCGVVAVDRRDRILLVFVPNESDRPANFHISGERIDRIRRELNAAHKKCVGLFHSHPIGDARPGPGDVRCLTVNDVTLIYDVCGRDARAWRVAHRSGRRHVIEVPLSIERSSRHRRVRQQRLTTRTQREPRL